MRIMTIKIWIESPYKNYIRKKIADKEISLSRNSPDFIITYGGDGTILRSESKYPGVPKIPIRKSHVCNSCVGGIDVIGKIKQKLLEKKYTVKKFEKVEVFLGKKKLVGLNEVQIHSGDPRKALRFSLEVGKQKFKEIIGDGLVFSTAYGSTAYYSALGYKPFKSGVKIGFNNPHNIPRQSIQLKGITKIKILRGSGILLADNQNNILKVKEGQAFIVRKSKGEAHFVVFK